MQNGVKIKKKLVKIKEELKSNIFFIALPYTILISALTIVGLFGGFALGNRLGSSMAGFSFSLFFSSLGFFLGFLISYLIVKGKYLMKGL
jgi:hypothetical protein